MSALTASVAAPVFSLSGYLGKRSVLKQGMALTIAGVAAGLTLTAVIARVAGGLLFGVDPTDKATYLAVAGLVATVSLAASYVPARHASRTDPMVVLRAD